MINALSIALKIFMYSIIHVLKNAKNLYKEINVLINALIKLMKINA